MKLYIPELKDQIKLSKDWSFILYPEDRNKTLGKKLGYYTETERWWGKWIDPKSNELFGQYEACTYNREVSKKEWKFLYNVILNKGTILQIDRIYVRKGQKEYSSVTFYIKNGEFKGCRFWAKLDEVNTIEFE